MRSRPLIGLVKPKAVEHIICEEQLCRRATRGGKRWCPEHVMRSPYAQHVAREDARRQGEILDVRTRGSKSIRKDSGVLEDVRNELLISGPRKVAKLSYWLKAEGLDSTTVWSYVIEARRRGLIVSRGVEGDLEVGHAW